MKAGWSSVRVHSSSESASSTDCPAGALDSGGRHCTKMKRVVRGYVLLTTNTAHGIIVPLLYTAQDAQKLVHSAKFPPLGCRGFGS